MRPPRVLAYDATEASWLGWSWRVGARLAAAQFDLVVGAATWADVYTAVGELADRRGAAVELDIWGHGAPGRPLIGGRALRPSAILLDVQRIWLRSCSVFRGARGRAYAAELAAYTAAAAHLVVIGPHGHSYLVGLERGAAPWWGDVAAEDSRPWAPRTIAPWSMSLPVWTWGPGAAALS